MVSDAVAHGNDAVGQRRVFVLVVPRPEASPERAGVAPVLLEFMRVIDDAGAKPAGRLDRRGQRDQIVGVYDVRLPFRRRVSHREPGERELQEVRAKPPDGPCDAPEHHSQSPSDAPEHHSQSPSDAREHHSQSPCEALLSYYRKADHKDCDGNQHRCCAFKRRPVSSPVRKDPSQH